MPLGLRYAARSDVGVVRPGNEDSGYAGSWLLAVADGMGGHAAGELASAIAVATFAEVADAQLSEGEALSVLGDAVDLSSERIADVIAREPQYQGMGTTFTGLAWLKDRLALVHVGDSRAYRYRGGELVQLTRDHTYVQTLVDSGQITPEEAAVHPRRNLIMRAIDGVHAVEPDLSISDLEVGDRYLLCSDGLSGVVGEDLIAQELAAGDPTGVVIRLVEAAIEGGAPDNVTVVVADVVELPDAAENNDLMPVVVGAAGESRNRRQLPNVPWPVDEQLDPDAANGAVATTEPAAEAREQDHLSRRPFWKNTALLIAGLFVILLAAFGGALLIWISSQWYVGEYQGNVAIYQGVPSDLGPISLNRLSQETAVPVSDLPVLDQERVQQSILADSEEQAISSVAQLDARAQECRSDTPPAGCPTQPPTTADNESASTPAPAETP
jgi:serine/threonine protein phosphatase PrpC